MSKYALTLEEAIGLAERVEKWNHRISMSELVDGNPPGRSFDSSGHIMLSQCLPFHRYEGQFEKFEVGIICKGKWYADHRQANPWCFLPEDVTKSSIVIYHKKINLAYYEGEPIPELYNLCLSIATKIENYEAAQKQRDIEIVQSVLNKARALLTS